jgi:hypothetical protein
MCHRSDRMQPSVCAALTATTSELALSRTEQGSHSRRRCAGPFVTYALVAAMSGTLCRTVLLSGTSVRALGT